MVGLAHRRAKDEEARRISAVDAFRVAEKSVQELRTKLAEEERGRKSAAAALDSAERQAESQRVLLRGAEDQLASSKQQIVALQKKLEEVQKAKESAEKVKEEAEKAKEEAEKERDEAEQRGYDIGVAETEDALRAEVSGVCRKYCSEVWIEALNQAGVETSSMLRKAESIYYPPAIRVAPSAGHPANPQLEVAEPAKSSSDVAPLSSTAPQQASEDPEGKEKEVGVHKKVVPDTTLPPTAPEDPAKEKEAPRVEIVLASLPIPPLGDPKGSDQGSTEATAQQTKAPPTGKIVIKKK